MRNLPILLLALHLFTVSCQKFETEPAVPGGNAVEVSVGVKPATETVITRSMDETAVEDVNIYLVSGERIYHGYDRARSLRMQVPPGDYTLYAVANYGGDMGARSAAALADFSYSCDDERYKNLLPMSSVTEVSVPAGTPSVMLPAVEVKRNMARINYTVRMDDAAGLTLHSLRWGNIPHRITPFAAPGALSCSRPEDYGPSGTTLCSGGTISGTLYMPENRQGVNKTITHQRQKSAENAPACASYLLLRATRGTEVFEYRVYLGQNNTTDFNVLGNTIHNMNVTILGTDEVDTRMSSYEVSMDETPEYSYSDGGLGAGDLIQGSVKVTGSNPGSKYRVCFTLFTSGLTINGDWSQDQYYDVPPSGEFYYEVAYDPGVLTGSNTESRYNVEVTDAEGYTQIFRRSYCWYNNLTVYTRSQQQGAAFGTVEMVGDDYHETLSNADYEWVRARCLEDGVHLTAKPKPGCTFVGWYADSRFLRLLSTNPQYDYVSQTTNGTLYARFTAPQSVRLLTDIYNMTLTCSGEWGVDGDVECFVVPYGSTCTLTPSDYFRGFNTYGWWDTFAGSGGTQLSTAWEYTCIATGDQVAMLRTSTPLRLDGKGTANCYITPQSGTTYAFRCWVKGNDKTTPNIKPTYNSCNYARVLWESGSVKGGVIRGVGTNSTDLVLTTGGSAGNAIVGVFDKDGVLRWSWHIWCTPYDPDATAQGYGSRTFMDRNLGATSVTPGLYSWGCYYQWGRKDPMPPAGNTQGYPEAPGVWEPGYKYVIAGGRGLENNLAWSIEHPTIFIAGTEHESQIEGPYLGDWIAPSNPNLWGDAKTIYDPCPVGWKVPGRTAWSDAGLGSGGTYTQGGYRFTKNGVSIFFPVAGIRLAGTGTVSYTGSQGFYWTSAPVSANAGSGYALGLYGPSSQNKTNPNANLLNSAAGTVRCVKE